MKTVRIFIASSAELQEERKALEDFLYQKSKLWLKERDIFFELINWEDFIDAVSRTRLQNEYNTAIKNCDIFVMLYWSKVGQYTREEFDTALAAFRDTGKPLMYVYYKDTPPPTTDPESLQSFDRRLKEIGHFRTVYANTHQFILHFDQQLDKLFSMAGQSPPAAEIPATMPKAQLMELIDKTQLFQAFEELNRIFLGKNDSLNALIYEFTNPPGNFTLALFTMRVKTFVSKNL